MTTDMLREAETDLAALAALPGEIRAKVKAGLGELQRLRDAIDTTIAGMTARANTTLASLEAMANADGQATATPTIAEAPADPATPPMAPAEGGAPAAGSFSG